MQPVAENKPEELALAHVEEAGPEKAEDAAAYNDAPLHEDFSIALVSDIEPAGTEAEPLPEDSVEEETERIDLSSALDIDFATPLDETAVEEAAAQEIEAEGAEGDETSESSLAGAEETGAADSGSPSANTESSGSQTASLREQGGRYMHRVSRRMRRRRGRFNHQGNGGDVNGAGGEESQSRARRAYGSG